MTAYYCVIIKQWCIQWQRILLPHFTANQHTKGDSDIWSLAKYYWQAFYGYDDTERTKLNTNLKAAFIVEGICCKQAHRNNTTWGGGGMKKNLPQFQDLRQNVMNASTAATQIYHNKHQGHMLPNTAYAMPCTSTSMLVRPQPVRISSTVRTNSMRAVSINISAFNMLWAYGIFKTWNEGIAQTQRTTFNTESGSMMLSCKLSPLILGQWFLMVWQSSSIRAFVIWFCCKLIVVMLGNFLRALTRVDVEMAKLSSGKSPQILDRSNCRSDAACFDSVRSTRSWSKRSQSRRDRNCKGHDRASSTSRRQPEKELWDRSSRTRCGNFSKVVVSWTRADVLRRVRPCCNIMLQFGRPRLRIVTKGWRSWQKRKNTLSSRFSSHRPSRFWEEIQNIKG